MKKSSGIASSCRIFPWSKASSGSSTFLHRLSSRKVAPFSRRKRSVERATAAAAAAAAQRMWSRIALRAGWVTERARSRAYRVSSPRWRAVFSRGIFLVLVSRVLTSQLTVRTARKSSRFSVTESAVSCPNFKFITETLRDNWYNDSRSHPRVESIR